MHTKNMELYVKSQFKNNYANFMRKKFILLKIIKKKIIYLEIYLCNFYLILLNYSVIIRGTTFMEVNS